MQNLKNTLSKLVEDFKKPNQTRKTLIQQIYDEIVDKMVVAATNGNVVISYNFKFLAEDRDNTAREVITMLRNEGVSVEQMFPDDQYLFNMRWDNDLPRTSQI